MAKKHFTAEQIITAIKRYDNGSKTSDICDDLNIACGTFYNWRNKYGGMSMSDTKNLIKLTRENKKMNRLLIEKKLEIKALKDILKKKW